jgi:hypothetical protein
MPLFSFINYLSRKFKYYWFDYDTGDIIEVRHSFPKIDSPFFGPVRGNHAQIDHALSTRKE